MRKILVLALGLVVFAITLTSFSSKEKISKVNSELKTVKDACIYGTAHRSDGSKVDGTIKVSTSWNGKKAFPKDGKYRLCLGSNPDKTITIYVDGKRYGKIYVDGDTELNIQLN